MQKQIDKHFKKLDIHEKKETDVVQKSSGNSINI